MNATMPWLFHFCPLNFSTLNVGPLTFCILTFELFTLQDGWCRPVGLLNLQCFLMHIRVAINKTSRGLALLAPYCTQIG